MPHFSADKEGGVGERGGVERERKRENGREKSHLSVCSSLVTWQIKRPSACVLGKLWL